MLNSIFTIFSHTCPTMRCNDSDAIPYPRENLTRLIYPSFIFQLWCWSTALQIPQVWIEEMVKYFLEGVLGIEVPKEISHCASVSQQAQLDLHTHQQFAVFFSLDALINTETKLRKKWVATSNQQRGWNFIYLGQIVKSEWGKFSSYSISDGERDIISYL